MHRQPSHGQRIAARPRALWCSLFCTLLLIACGSDDDDGGSVGAAEPAVTGEFHDIDPRDIDSYIADFERDRSRIRLTLDGVAHDDLTFVEPDEENELLVVSFGEDDLLLIGVDLAAERPRDALGVIEVDGDAVTRQWVGTELSLTLQDNGDALYAGRLHTIDDDGERVGDEEIDVQLVFNDSLIEAGTSQIIVSGTDAVLTGDLGTLTYVQMRDVLATNAGLERLVLQSSSGSVNDAINVHTGRLVRDAALHTHVPADGDINSGAVDLFTAGARRSIDAGAKLGVHSWCCGDDGEPANRLPRSSDAHGTQLTYFREMLGATGEDFYFFTLDAAPFDSIHVMTPDEIARFGLVTP